MTHTSSRRWSKMANLKHYYYFYYYYFYYYYYYYCMQPRLESHGFKISAKKFSFSRDAKLPRALHSVGTHNSTRASRRGKQVPDSSRDKNEGAYRCTGEGGEEPA